MSADAVLMIYDTVTAIAQNRSIFQVLRFMGQTAKSVSHGGGEGGPYIFQIPDTSIWLCYGSYL